MKFAEMITYWEMKSMISKRHIMSSNKMYDSVLSHHVESFIVSSEVMTANIIYRKTVTEHKPELTKYALIYADILFVNSFSGNTVFKKDAKVSDLQSEFL